MNAITLVCLALIVVPAVLLLGGAFVVAWALAVQEKAWPLVGIMTMATGFLVLSVLLFAGVPLQ